MFTPWPPGPLDRYTSTRISSSGMSMWSVCSTTGITSTPGERGLPAALVVVLGDADHPVRAVLAAQRPVGVGRVDRERGGLDPGLFGVGGVVDLGRVAVPLRPAQVHPQQVLREVGRVGAAGLRVDRDQRLPGVVLAGQQRAHLQLVDLGPQRGQLAPPPPARVGSSFSLSASSNSTWVSSRRRRRLASLASSASR